MNAHDHVSPLHQTHFAPTSHLSGEVIFMDADSIKVRTQSGLIQCKVAASCLLQPALKDLVYFVTIDSNYYILAILERAASQKHTLQFNAETQISVQGDLNITSKNTQINSTETLKMNALTAQFNFGLFQQISQKCVQVSHKLIQKIGFLNLTAKREHKLLDQQFEQVRGSKQSTALRYTQRVQQQYSLRSERAIIRAEKDLKVDGERINLG